jgi:cytochrome c556
MTRKGIFWLGVCTLFLAATSTHLFAQEEIVKKRKDLMQAQNSAIKAITKATEEKDYATIDTKAKEIMGTTENIFALFPKGSVTEKSRAHPDIWVKSDDFKNRAANTRKAAEALSKAAAAKNEAEVSAKVKDLGNNREGACGDCHKLYRADFRKDS